MNRAICTAFLGLVLLIAGPAEAFQLLNAPHGTVVHTDTEVRWCAPGGGGGQPPGDRCDPKAANNDITVTYTKHTGLPADWRPRIDAAAQTWNALPPQFRFVAAAADERREFATDQHNMIFMGQFNEIKPPLARTRLVFDLRQITTPSGINNPSTMGKIIDADIKINSEKNWFTGATCDSIPADAFDLQTTVLHEFGHWLKLKDLTQFVNLAFGSHPTHFAVMGPGAPGICKRRLDTPETTDDRYGFQYLYQLEFR